MSSNRSRASAPSRTTRRGHTMRGRPPLNNRPRNQRQVVGNVDVSQLSNEIPFPAPAIQSPSILNYNPHQELTRSVSSDIETSSNMNIGHISTDGGASVDQQRINRSPQTGNQFEGLNELSNRSLFPGSFQNNFFRNDHTDEEKLQFMLRNLPSRAGSASQASFNSSIMANTTSLNGHVGQNNYFGSYFESGSTSNTGIVNRNNLFGSRIEIVNENNIFGSTTTRSNQAINFGPGSSFGSRTDIANQKDFFGSTTTLSNQANTNGTCIDDNQLMSMLPVSHGSHYMKITSMYRDHLARVDPREFNLVVENGGEEDQQINNRRKEPMIIENNITGVGVSEGYSCELLVPEEMPSDGMSKGYNCELLVPKEMANENILEPLPKKMKMGNENVPEPPSYNCELLVPKEMPNEKAPKEMGNENVPEPPSGPSF